MFLSLISLPILLSQLVIWSAAFHYLHLSSFSQLHTTSTEQNYDPFFGVIEPKFPYCYCVYISNIHIIMHHIQV